MRVAVVGGGIAGLAAAWELRGRAEVTVFEPGRLGGKLQTSEFAGRLVDEGADAFLTRVPEALDLCAELGLTEELVAPAAGRTLLW
ncbi:MAG: FAD-dependent oxidoreductase, partial [Acidimicrobiales bacterium]